MKKNSSSVCGRVKGQKNIVFKNVQKSKAHSFGWVQRSIEHHTDGVKGQKN
jgi:hypothetical protein